MKALSSVLVLAVTLAQSVGLFAANLTVTNLNDSGIGSLRQAILESNSSAGNVIAFSVNGTIRLDSPLPTIGQTMTIDGTSAPGYAGAPVVAVDFDSSTGLVIGLGANESIIKGLSLIGAANTALTIEASDTTVAANYIGLTPGGTVRPNAGDGIRVNAPSTGNLIGNDNPVTSITYGDASDAVDFPIQPVSAWQGLRNYAAVDGQFLICGTSNDDGLLYVGPFAGGGQSYPVIFPGPNTTVTSVYGPDNADAGKVRLVGSYRSSDSGSIFNYGFVWEGMLNQLPSGGVFRQIAYPNATYQFTHSTMGDLAVGNADSPTSVGGVSVPLGPGVAYIYNVATQSFITTIVFPGSKSNTAYGIWQNGPNSYTICGGYSPIETNNMQDQSRPLDQGKAYLVDYNAATNTLSNWTSFDYPNGPLGVNFITHFEGISSVEAGVYTLNADSVQANSSNVAQGSFVSVLRNADGSFTVDQWVDLNFNNTTDSITSSNSVYGNNVVGLVIGNSTFSYQATVNVGFQLSNVISGNGGNGITLADSDGNVVAMNFIGTDPAGSSATGFGNTGSGIYVTQASKDNLIGGTAFGVNNPTGSKNPANAVFQRPIQGNLISGNRGHGVLVDGQSLDTVLSGNFIGTDESGVVALGNQQNGVTILNAPRTSLLGCSFYNEPFVYYNVIAGNVGNGVLVENSNDVVIQANFLGMGGNNTTSVPNGGNGLLVAGSSRNTQVGGVIPLGNVISGNTLHGIEVRDTATGFISFNTFGGIAAFQTFPSPNGQNGIHITSTGGNNTVRTCIISGNGANGIEIGGNASGVEITDTSVGTTTGINGAIPNQGSGIVISGTAHNNAIGGFQPSVERTVYASGNDDYGIAIVDQARNNKIYGTNVGITAGANNPLPNEAGGILLDVGTSGTTIGGEDPRYRNNITSNDQAGLYINASTNNDVIRNTITYNTVVGLFATGACNGTFVTNNTVENNGPGGTNNIDISNATGITFGPRPVPTPPPVPPAPAPAPTPNPAITAEVDEIVFLQDQVLEISRNVKNPVVRQRQIRKLRNQIRRINQRLALQQAAGI